MKKELKDEKLAALEPILAIFGAVTVEMVRDISECFSKQDMCVLCVHPDDTDNADAFNKLGASVIFSVITK